jgi:hypothetical protein
MELAMTTPILIYLVFGAFFGLATYGNRHLFNEGPRRRGDVDGNDPLDGRLMWTAICTALWPLMVLTGFVTLWKHARVRVPPRERDRR